jgi:hypothetical protein
VGHGSMSALFFGNQQVLVMLSGQGIKLVTDAGKMSTQEGVYTIPNAGGSARGPLGEGLVLGSLR